VETFDPSKGSVKTWICYLARCKALRRRQYLASRNFYGTVGIGSRKSSLFADDDLEAQLLLRERRALLKDVIEKLPPGQRRTMMLFYFDDMELQEISEALNLSHENVRHHYYRGIKKLRDALTAAQ